MHASIGRFTYLLVALLLPFLAACQWLERQQVEGIAKHYVRSAVRADYAEMRKMAGNDAEYRTMKDFMEGELGSADLRRRLDGLTLTTLHLDGKYAKVQAVGTIRYGIPFTSYTTPLEWDIELVKRDGKWYIDGLHAA